MPRAPRLRQSGVVVLAEDPRPKQLDRPDARKLERLVHKHGKDAIVAAIDAVRPTRKRGGQPRPFKSIYDAMNAAQWFDSVVEDYRSKGSKKPIEEAEIYAYNIACEWAKRHPGCFKHSGRFESWRKNFQKKRSLGQRHLKELNRSANRAPQINR